MSVPQKQSQRKRTNGRTKGASYENVVAKLISAWCGFKVVRTPLSGGWAHSNERTDVGGDLVSGVTGKDLAVCVECKCYGASAWSWDAVLAGKCVLLSDWVDQAMRESAGRPWMLVFRRNRTPSYVAVDGGIFVAGDHANAFALAVSLGGVPHIYLQRQGAYVFLLSDFLSRVPYPISM